MKNNLLKISLMCVLVLFLLNGCQISDQQEIKSTVLSAIDSPIVKQIRSLETPEGILLGDLIESGMGSCTYELYDPAEDGNTYVTISGNITYNNIPVVAKLQYKKVDDNNYEFYTLVYNDLPRNAIETDAFFEYLYDAYEKEKGLSKNKDSDTSSNQEPSQAPSEEPKSQPVVVNQNENFVSIDETEVIKSYVDIKSMVYEFGKKSSFSSDFNGDGIQDTVTFYFEQIWFYLTYVDGATNSANHIEVYVPEFMLDENGEIPLEVETLLSVCDLDLDGDHEFLITYSSPSAMAAMTIYDAKEVELDLMGVIEGQFEYVIFDDGQIFAPIGSQGLGNVYKYSDYQVSTIE